MKETLNWEVEQPSERIRGRGINATKKITVWARTAPVGEHIELDGRLIMIREEPVFANVGKAPAIHDRTFYQGWGEAKATNKLIEAEKIPGEKAPQAKHRAYGYEQDSAAAGGASNNTAQQGQTRQRSPPRATPAMEEAISKSTEAVEQKVRLEAENTRAEM